MTQSELTTSHLLGTAHGERGRLEKCDLQQNRLHYTKCMHVHVLAIRPRQLPTFNLCCRQGKCLTLFSFQGSATYVTNNEG